MNILRRLPLSRLLLLCALVVGIGASATAIALALGSGEKPPPKPLAQAVHDAVAAPPVEGLSATVTYTNHLLEGANLAAEHGSGPTSSPLVAGASGRLWIAKDGRARLELKSEKGDTNIVWDGTTVTAYDAAENIVYRYTPPKQEGTAGDSSSTDHGETPSVAKIEEGITKLEKHANVSGATPTNVGGQPAYTVRVGPQESGSLIGGAELSFDANTGVPLRAAVYSSTTSSPVIELAADNVSYAPVPDSVFQISPAPGAKIETIELKKSSDKPGTGGSGSGSGPTLTTHGKGITAVQVLETKAGSGSSSSLESLPKVKLANGASASELSTALGTVLTFERAGARYIVAGALEPPAVEAVAGSL
jgi:outer membrane lipoprotein-sorting protein